MILNCKKKDSHYSGESIQIIFFLHSADFFIGKENIYKEEKRRYKEEKNRTKGKG